MSLNSFIGIKKKCENKIEWRFPLGFGNNGCLEKEIESLSNQDKEDILLLLNLVLKCRHVKRIFSDEKDEDKLPNILAELISYKDKDIHLPKNLKTKNIRSYELEDYSNLSQLISKNNVMFTQKNIPIPDSINKNITILDYDILTYLYSYVLYYLIFYKQPSFKIDNQLYSYSKLFEKMFIGNDLGVFDYKNFRKTADIFYYLDRNIKVRTPIIKNLMNMLWDFFRLNIFNKNYNKDFTIKDSSFWIFWEYICLSFIEKEVLEKKESVKVIYSDIPFFDSYLLNENGFYDDIRIEINRFGKKLKVRLKPDLVLQDGEKIFIIDYKYFIYDNKKQVIDKNINDVFKQKLYEKYFKEQNENFEVNSIFLVPKIDERNFQVEGIQLKNFKKLLEDFNIQETNTAREQNVLYKEAIKHFLNKNFEDFNYLNYFTDTEKKDFNDNLINEIVTFH